MKRVLGIGVFCVLAFLVGSRDAGATQITFTASAGASCALSGGTNTSSTVAIAVATQGTCLSNGISGQAQAFASGGGLGAMASVSYFCCPSSAGGSGFGQLDTTVFFTGPAGFVDVSIAMLLTSTFLDGDGPGNSSFVSLKVDGFLGGGSVIGVNTTAPFTNFIGVTPFVIGTANNIVLGSFHVPTNTPLQMQIGLTAAVTAFGNTTVETLNALNTLKFNPNGPVFILPSGYGVVDIPELNIFNNQFVVPGSTAPVPEPSALVLLGSGLAALGFVARRRSRKELR